MSVERVEIKEIDSGMDSAETKKKTFLGVVTENEETYHKNLSMVSPSKRPLPRPLFGFSPLKRFDRAILTTYSFVKTVSTDTTF